MLVTAARGFIGAWVVKTLLATRRYVVALDQDPDRARLAQVLEDDETGLVTELAGDITVLEALSQVLADHPIGAVISHAAFQVPACAANPNGQTTARRANTPIGIVARLAQNWRGVA